MLRPTRAQRKRCNPTDGFALYEGASASVGPPLQLLDARRSLSRKFERVFGERVAKDAGNPSGAGHFTISTALGNKRCEDNEHKYDEARSFAKSRLVHCIPEAVPTNKKDYSPGVTKRSLQRELVRLVGAWGESNGVL